MGKIIIKRKKSIDSRMPYSVLIDGSEIGKVENGETKEFEVTVGKHSIVITGNEEDFAEKIGATVGGALGLLMGKVMDKYIKKYKEKHKKNEAVIEVLEDKNITIVCASGAFDAIIKEIN